MLARGMHDDLGPLADRVKADKEFAKALYSAMCNMRWAHDDNGGKLWSITWRNAGDVVAQLCGNQSLFGYMEFYASGNEGEVSTDVATALKELGWTAVDYNCPYCGKPLETNPLSGVITCFVHPQPYELPAINKIRANMGRAPLLPGDTSGTDRGPLVVAPTPPTP